jgi:hypothetical protein
MNELPSGWSIAPLGERSRFMGAPDGWYMMRPGKGRVPSAGRARGNSPPGGYMAKPGASRALERVPEICGL